MKEIIRIITVFVLGFVILPSCTDTEEEEDRRNQAQEQRFFDLYMASTFLDTIDPPTESGLYYIPFEEGTGPGVGEDDWVYVDYVAYVIPGDLVVETYLENVALSSGIYSDAALYGPFKMQNGTVNEGLTEGLSLMKEGGKSIMCFKSELAYGKAGASLMQSVGEYQSMKYEVELLEVIGSDIESYELDRMVSYADSIPGLDTIYDPLTESYMYYIVDEPQPDSAYVVLDTVVAVAYKGYLTDGRVFDESDEDDPLIFTMATGNVIDGWILGLQRFREGEKGRLIIPYTLAYGETGNKEGSYVGIPPYETLVFDVEIKDMAGYEEEDEEPDL